MFNQKVKLAITKSIFNNLKKYKKKKIMINIISHNSFILIMCKVITQNF